MLNFMRGRDDPDQRNPDRGNTMNNPATIPDSVMLEFERIMGRAADMQATRRHVVKHHGRAEWAWLSTTPHERHGRERLQAARAILEARELIRAKGFDTWAVCSIARDPDGHAFCYGGATADDLRRESQGE
jgi:hypothetical protein